MVIVHSTPSEEFERILSAFYGGVYTVGGYDEGFYYPTWFAT
jgi:hypothetical protein